MALSIKNEEVERLVTEMAALTGESKTEAVKRALLERQARLTSTVSRRDRRADLIDFLEREVWPTVPAAILGVQNTKAEIEEILGYGPEGV